MPYSEVQKWEVRMLKLLRDEILVVSRYDKIARSGLGLIQKIEAFRRQCGNNKRVSMAAFVFEIKKMTKEGIFNPWIKVLKGKGLKQVDNLDAYDPLRVMFFTLTYKGYEEHGAVVNRLTMERGDFRKLFKKTPGQSK